MGFHSTPSFSITWSSWKPLDCEQSLFFFRFSESNARARERRSCETRETRAARGHLRVSRFARRTTEKRETTRSLENRRKKNSRSRNWNRRFRKLGYVHTKTRNAIRFSMNSYPTVWLSTSEIRMHGTATVRYCSEITVSSYMWTEALSGKVFVPAQKLSSRVWT